MNALKTILLVEDNPSNVELALEALADLASQISVFNDGEGRSITGTGGGGSRGASPRRGVLLDLKIPKVDGFAVLRTVKADSALKPHRDTHPPRARSATSSRAIGLA